MAKKYKRVEIASAYKRCFGSKDGKIVLYDLMNSFGMLVPSFNPAEVNPNSVLVNEGQRSVVLSIFKELKMDVGKMRKFIDERSEHDDNIYN